MQNFIQPGNTITLTAPYARTSGQGALVGSIFGVAAGDIANGAAGEFLVEGVLSLDKVSTEVWTPGVRVYWDNAAKLVTSVVTSNTLIGVAAAATVNPSAKGPVRLNGAF